MPLLSGRLEVLEVRHGTPRRWRLPQRSQGLDQQVEGDERKEAREDGGGTDERNEGGLDATTSDPYVLVVCYC